MRDRFGVFALIPVRKMVLGSISRDTEESVILSLLAANFGVHEVGRHVDCDRNENQLK